MKKKIITRRKNIIFIANNNLGKSLSGGDRIFVELMRGWKDKINIFLFGSEEAIELTVTRGVRPTRVVQTSLRNKHGGYLSFSQMFTHIIIRVVRGLIVINRRIEWIKKADYIYSCSDFYPDFLPALWSKVFNSKIKWIACYYLFAPTPFSAESPYKGNAWLKGLLYWLMQKPSYFIIKRCADCVFVTSEPDVGKFITSKRSRDKIVVVQGGVDITSSEKYLKSKLIIPVAQKKYDACFLGRFHYQKGVLELVDIWKLVCQKKPLAKLAMIGNGALEESVLKKIQQYRLEKNIDLLGFLDGEQKYEIFKQSKIIVHPATYDSGGMAAAEGMAWGLPGVSFDLESLKTYYPYGMIKTKCYSLQEFAGNILLLLKDKKLYNKISKEALALITEVWDWKKRTDFIYRKIFYNETQMTKE